jgi:hypothetical protein
MSDYMLFALLSNECPDPLRVNRAIDVLRGADGPEPDEAQADDVEADPAEWPSWTDQRWTIGPEPDDDGPSDADLDEMAKYCEWTDRVAQAHRYTDDDLRAAGLPVG